MQRIGKTTQKLQRFHLTSEPFASRLQFPDCGFAGFFYCPFALRDLQLQRKLEAYATVSALFLRGSFGPKYSYHIFHWDDEELIIGFKVYGNGIFGVKVVKWLPFRFLSLFIVRDAE